MDEPRPAFPFDDWPVDDGPREDDLVPEASEEPPPSADPWDSDEPVEGEDWFVAPDPPQDEEAWDQNDEDEGEEILDITESPRAAVESVEASPQREPLNPILDLPDRLVLGYRTRVGLPLLDIHDALARCSTSCSYSVIRGRWLGPPPRASGSHRFRIAGRNATLDVLVDGPVFLTRTRISIADVESEAVFRVDPRPSRVAVVIGRNLLAGHFVVDVDKTLPPRQGTRQRKGP